MLDKDRLLRMDAQVIDRRQVGRQTVVARESASLQAVRADRGEPQRIKVAILTDNRRLADSISPLVDSMGWTSEFIRPAELVPSASRYWDLVVIATNGESLRIPSVCAQASRDSRQRVLVVSGNQDPQLIADALNSGADDYLISPFDADECRARMRALVKRAEQSSQPNDGILWVEPLLRTIGIGTRYATLSTREWSLLSILIQAHQEPVEAAVIEDRIWGVTGRQSTLASVVSRLRDRIQAHRLVGIEIITVRGVGYAIRFKGLDVSRIYGSSDVDQLV